MNKILYSLYTGEYPNQFVGGPNNIIYKLINNYIEKDFVFDYLSSDLFADNLTKSNLISLYNRLSPKKKTAANLSKKSHLYRKFFGSDFYLPYHFYKKNRYYNLFATRANSYNIIHAHDSIALGLIANRNTSSKKIMTIHSKGALSDEIRQMPNSRKLSNKLDSQLKAIERKSIKVADVITFPSKAARKYFENSLNVNLDNKEVKIIYNGIDFNSIQNITDDGILNKYSIKKNDNKLLLLNIAGDVPEKNIDILIRIVGEIKNRFNKDVELINIGIYREDAAKYLDLAKKMDISNSIKFLGKLPNEDVIKLLKVTDIFIMTSKKVIFDLVVLEALASGACCVVSDDGGNKEIIKNGENGYLINTNDVESIAKKIITIFPNKVKENAINTAKQFTVQKMVNEYFEVYESLLNEV